MDPTKLSCSAWQDEIERRRRLTDQDDGPPRKIFSSLREYNKRQLEQMLGDVNRHFTREALIDQGTDREPTRGELADNFERKGGSDEFRKWHCFRLSEEVPALMLMVG